MRIVAYTRLSQANDHEAESHAAQYERIVAWAKEHGHEVVAHRRDTTSGENALASRAGLAGALDTLKDGIADGLAFSALDRLSRDVIVQESVLRDVWREGHEAFSATPGEGHLRDDPEDPSRRLIRVMLGAVAEYERAMTALRMTRGRRRAIAEGRLIGPAPSFGWTKDAVDRGLPVPDPSTYPLVEEAVRRRADGDQLRVIAEFLASETNRAWHPTQVKRLLDRHHRYSSGRPRPAR